MTKIGAKISIQPHFRFRGPPRSISFGFVYGEGEKKAIDINIHLAK